MCGVSAWRDGVCTPGTGIWNLWGTGLSRLSISVLSFLFTWKQGYITQSQERVLVTSSPFSSFAFLTRLPATSNSSQRTHSDSQTPQTATHTQQIPPIACAHTFSNRFVCPQTCIPLEFPCSFPHRCTYQDPEMHSRTHRDLPTHLHRNL